LVLQTELALLSVVYSHDQEINKFKECMKRLLQFSYNQPKSLPWHVYCQRVKLILSFVHDMKSYKRVEIQLKLFLISTLDGGE
jgi:hypothetical protein